MLERKYRTLTVKYNNHEDLLNDRFDNVVSRLEPILKNLEKRMKNETLLNNHYTAVRVAPGNYIIIYVAPGNDANLFLLASNGEKISDNIKGEFFERLDNEYIIYDFEEKCRNIERSNYIDQSIVQDKLKAVLPEKYLKPSASINRYHDWER